jgi:hypothetical protein
MLTALVVSAVCAAVFGVLAAVGVLAAIAMGMIERGFSGAAATGVVALLCALGAGITGAGLLMLASRHIAHDEATRLERAEAAGEAAPRPGPQG